MSICSKPYKQKKGVPNEELEALRPADLEGQHQVQAAATIGISRSTFQRILAEARRKTAQALVNGLALQVEGGTFRVAEAYWHCTECGYDWGLLHGSGRGQPDACPLCNGQAIEQRQN